jgi:hypothetical protein
MLNFTSRHRWLTASSLALLTTLSLGLMNVSINPANAQSTDRDRPTLLKSNEVKGALSRQDDVFYGFNAKPGNLQITFDVKPSGGSIAVASVQFYDAKGNELLPVGLMISANSPGGDRKTATINIPTQQRILMRVTEGTGYGANYRIRLEGAIELSQPNSGKLLKLPNSGKLRVELKDGSVHEFDLRNVKQAVIN